MAALEFGKPPRYYCFLSEGQLKRQHCGASGAQSCLQRCNTALRQHFHEIRMLHLLSGSKLTMDHGSWIISWITDDAKIQLIIIVDLECKVPSQNLASLAM
jgi:hypothetical protein